MWYPGPQERQVNGISRYKYFSSRHKLSEVIMFKKNVVPPELASYQRPTYQCPTDNQDSKANNLLKLEAEINLTGQDIWRGCSKAPRYITNTP